MRSKIKYDIYEDDFIYRVGPPEYHDIGWRVDVGKGSYKKDRNPVFDTKQEAQEYRDWLMLKAGVKKLNLPIIKKR